MSDKLRLLEWLVIGLAFYVLAIALAPLAHMHPEGFAQLQTAAWKAGHVTLGAYLGYWIDRRAFGRIDEDSDGLRQGARALVIAAAIAGLALGL